MADFLDRRFKHLHSSGTAYILAVFLAKAYEHGFEDDIRGVGEFAQDVADCLRDVE